MKTMTYDRRERIIARNKARRVRELKNKMIVGIVTVFLICMFSIFCGSFLSQAKENKPEDVKCFKSVMVEYGESLDQVILRTYDMQHYSSVEDYKSEVIRINSIASADVITPGQFVVVPYYSVL